MYVSVLFFSYKDVSTLSGFTRRDVGKNTSISLSESCFRRTTMLANPFERRYNFSSRRNKNRLLVHKEWLFIDSELELGVAAIADEIDTGN